MYQKQLTIKLSEKSSLYQNLDAIATQKGTTIDALLEKIAPAGLYALLENNLAFVVEHEYNRLPVQPLCLRDKGGAA